MPHGKASGPDGKSIEKASGASLDQQLAILKYQMLERKFKRFVGNFKSRRSLNG